MRYLLQGEEISGINEGWSRDEQSKFFFIGFSVIFLRQKSTMKNLDVFVVLFLSSDSFPTSDIFLVLRRKK